MKKDLDKVKRFFRRKIKRIIRTEPYDNNPEVYTDENGRKVTKYKPGYAMNFYRNLTTKPKSKK